MAVRAPTRRGHLAPPADPYGTPPGSPQTAGGGRRRPVIVVGYDRREESEAALDAAVEQAGKLSTDLRVVHAVDLRDYPVDPDMADFEEQGQARLDEERRHVAAVLSGRGPSWSYIQARGNPASLLIAAAQDANTRMIVIGGHTPGIGGLIHRLLSPAVLRRLMKKSLYPVLVVTRANQTLLRSETAT